MKRIQRKQRLIPTPPDADGVSTVYTDAPPGTRRTHCPHCRRLVNATVEPKAHRCTCPGCGRLLVSELF